MTESETDQVERETELHRDRVAGLLDELRTRLSPGEIVDQVLGSMRQGAPQDFARNLGTQVRNNPLPCVLIGAGMAWLMIGGRNVRPNGAASAGRTDAAGTASQSDEQARDTVDRSVDQLSGAASSAAQVTGDAARQAGSRLARLAQEQPLVLAGIGIAVGAAVASLFPVTETENRLVGWTSDKLKDRARDLATEGVEKVQAVAATAVETATAAATQAAQQEASRQGLTYGGEHGTACREESRNDDPDATDGRSGESRDAADGRR